ncbi:Leucine Rich repeat [Phytophthora infestans]|uniref:Leucine Rich repeat n=1 Tax=Phytophthora infestans TaxID=4787 RepID=A0A833SPY1_PHYIN|nr:Leucine Rich repeat [Phytophthora infestans]
MISAIAPAIGADAVVGQNLLDGVRNLFEFIKKATKKSVGTITKISLLHGTHFAPMYSGKHDLFGDIDDKIEITPFRMESYENPLGEFIRFMSLSQRRMMVRWLNAWKPRNGDAHDKVFLYLKKHFAPNFQTIEINRDATTDLNLKTSEKLFRSIAFTLLRVTQEGISNLSEHLVSRCELVVINNKSSEKASTAIRYQLSQFPIESVVAVEDYLMLTFVRENTHTDGRFPKCRVIGRVLFVDRATVEFTTKSTVRIRHVDDAMRNFVLDVPVQISAVNEAEFPTRVFGYLQTIRENRASSLDISSSDIDDNAVIALAHALRQNIALTSVFLQDNPILERGVKAIEEMLWYNSTLLDIHLSNGEINTTSKRLRQQTGHRVFLWTRTQEEEVLRVLGDIRQGRTDIVLEGSEVDDGGAMAIANALKNNDTASSLHFRYNRIGDRGVIALTDALKMNTKVRMITLSEYPIGDDGAKALAEVLRANETITELHLTGRNIGDEGVKALAESLMVTKSMETFSLSETRSEDDVAHALAKALLLCPMLYHFSLSDCHFGDDGAIAFAEALAVNESLRFVDFSGNHVGDHGARAVAAAIKVNHSIYNLSLARNCIGDDGAKALADALKVNTNLLYLTLLGNRIGNEGAFAMVQGLDENSTIERLDLKENNLEDAMISELQSFHI